MSFALGFICSHEDAIAEFGLDWNESGRELTFFERVKGLGVRGDFQFGTKVLGLSLKKGR